MSNRVKRNTIFIEAMMKVNSEHFGEGEIIGLIKTKCGWHHIDSNLKGYRFFIDHIRNDECIEIREQYSLHDICNWLMEKDTSYQTVCYAILEDKVEEALMSIEHFCTLDDVYEYIALNLL